MNRKLAGRSRSAQTRAQKPPSATSVLDLDVSRNDWLALPSLGGKQANDNGPSEPIEDLYSLKHVSERWDVSMSTLYREIDRGKLKAEKIGGQWRVSSKTLTAYRDRRTENRYPRLIPTPS